MRKIFYIFLPLVILMGIFVYYVFNLNSHNIEEQSIPNYNEPQSTEEWISQILHYSKTGQIIEASFQVGVTKLDEVNQVLGEPTSIEKTDLGSYASYSNNITIGYQNSLAFDLRSYDTKLNQIHLTDIKNILGEPDNVKYYQDDIYDQIILIYQVDPKYQLKWILPKPSEQEQNPSVHHISVFTEPPITTQMINKLINMSLDEKIGQLIFAGIDGKNFDEKASSLIHQYKVGGIIFNKKNFISPDQTITFVNKIKQENTQNPLPIFLGVDQEGGRVSKLPGSLKAIPTNLQIGNRDNEEFSYSIGEVLGEVVQSFGFNMNFAPVLDINSNLKNPVIGDRSFGNNAELVSRLGIATMKGIQAQNTIAVIKHFPGHGDTATDSHLELPKVNKSIEELHQLELIPFTNAINNGADVVMIAHILLPQIDSSNPSSMSEAIITDLLRNELHYEGVVITDDMTMEAITDHYNIGDASVQSIKAGSDIVMVAHNYENVVSVINAIKAAVINGEISEERINESVLRIIQLKEKYQLKDDPTENIDIQHLNKQIEDVLTK